MILVPGARPSRREIRELLEEARAHTLRIVETLTPEELRRQHDPLMSPIVWDLGHVGHFEEVWLLEKACGASLPSPLPPLAPSEGTSGHIGPVGVAEKADAENGDGRGGESYGAGEGQSRSEAPTQTPGPGHGDGEGLRGIFDPFRHPRATRDQLPLPTGEEALSYLESVRREVLSCIDGVDFDSENPLLAEAFVVALVLQHEYQHGETILQTLQLKRGRPFDPLPARSPSAEPPDDVVPLDGAMVRFPGGDVPIGTDDRSVAYDNERPRHVRSVEPFWMDVTPVTNAAWLRFMEDGGYGRRELWSSEGLRWLRSEGAVAPRHWIRGDDGAWRTLVLGRERTLLPHAPVCHVGWFEAEAYARWVGRRLPTEVEWEAAATWDPGAERKRLFPWGDAPPTRQLANLDGARSEPAPVDAFPDNVSPIGCVGMIGDVWEWTASDFDGYPGFRAFPYREYSEVFFGSEYKVLRGGSWATRPGAIRGTFRNWDYPVRRQIFSGLRCARDD